MELVSSECIILRNQDFGERDRLVTFLTAESGRVRGIVKGSRKLTSRGVGSFEPFGRGLMHYVPKASGGLVTIRKCDPLPPYLYLSGDYDAYLYAGYLSELVELCPIESAEAAPLFDLLTETLNVLCEAGSPRRLPLLRLRFELRFLELLGVQPHWRQCCRCGRALLAGGMYGEQAGGGQEGGGEDGLGGDGAGEVVGGGEDAKGDPLAPLTPQTPQTPQTPIAIRAASEALHGFDPRDGGVVCPTCLESRRTRLFLPPRSLVFLEQWRGGAPGARPSRDTLAALEAAVTEHLLHHLERRPKSLALLPGLDAL